jgi:hypothetical protein
MNNKNYLNIFLLLINTILLKLTYNRTIYTCGFRNYKNFQCYDEVKKGDNNVIYLKKCESNEICQKTTTEKKDNEMGICIRKLSRYVDNHSCRVNSECTSYICDKRICKGLPEGRKCLPNRYQCKNGLVCRNIAETDNNNNNFINEEFYICTQPVKENEPCKLSTDCELNYVCSRNSNFINRKVCTKIGSQKTGTKVDDEMACKSGDMKYVINDNICIEWEEIIYDCGVNINLDENYCSIIINIGNGNNYMIVNETCEISSKGAYLCNDGNKTINFEKYVGIYNKRIKKLEKKIEKKKFNIEKFRYNLDNLDVSKKYFEYKFCNLVYDADECAYNYLFNLNEGKYLKFYYKIFLFIFVILNIFN